jgi:hypothetical protein
LREILKERKNEAALKLLDSTNLELHEATNHFGDEFHVLLSRLPFPEYEKWRTRSDLDSLRLAARDIADTALEMEYYIRFILIDFELKAGDNWDFFICCASESSVESCFVESCWSATPLK